MIDISDGLGLDLDRLCRASGVGVRLDHVPVAQGASEEEALGGGDDYELLVAAPPHVDLSAAFDGAGLAQPILIGELVHDHEVRLFRGDRFDTAGYQHPLS